MPSPCVACAFATAGCRLAADAALAGTATFGAAAACALLAACGLASDVLAICIGAFFCELTSCSKACAAAVRAEAAAGPFMASSSSRADQAFSASGFGSAAGSAAEATERSSSSVGGMEMSSSSSESSMESSSSSSLAAVVSASAQGSTPAVSKRSATQPTNMTQEQGFSQLETPVAMQP